MANHGNRGRAYTSVKDVILSQSWVSITQDPLVSNNQSGTQFWDRVLLSFVSLLDSPTDRTAGSLSSYFCAISKSVALFIAKLGSVKNRAVSGTTEANKLHEARMEYIQSSKKAFKFDECYQLHKDQLKFSLRTTHLRLPSMQDLNTDIPIDIDSPTPLSRPPGRKEEKKKGKRLAEFDELADMVEETKIFNSFYKEAQDRKIVTLEKKVAIKEKEYDLKIRMEEDRIMSLDLSSLPEHQRIYFMRRKHEIMRRGGDM